ncbi:MAG: MarR family winged helix-turn-helix transcriptional regulator [Gammaproteobacteria bacterium]
MDAGDTPKDECQETVLRLEEFLPYRLSLASNIISSGIADLYAERFNLTIAQWRIMAVIGRFDDLSAREVAERTAMDKVAVSRALKGLEESGHLHRSVSAEDRRRSVLALTRAGRVIYNQVAPIAIDYERRLLEGLDETEQSTLAQLLDRLKTRAQQL